MAFAPKLMEKATGESIGGAKVDAAAPSWLMRYLSTMKQQIKKEVMEEICAICHCSKTGKLEENQLDFQGEVIHTDIFCDNCDQLIHGIRYKCGNCSDFDLCQECESLPNIHNKHHIFLKIRNPMALKMYQRQKMQEITSPTTGKIFVSRTRQSKKLYEAKFVRDETISDGTVLPPSTKFVKSWKVINSGTRVWTHATKLHLIQGSQALVPSSEQIDVPHLKPGEEGIVHVVFTSPSEPGVYRSHWNFCHKSRPFGDIVWCHIMVKPSEEAPPHTEVITTEDVALIPNKMISPEAVNENKQKEVSSIAEVLTAVQKEHDRGTLIPRKLAVSSHTATPNNTPFDLTPPKSPDHQTTSVKDLHNITENNSSHKESDNEDECSILSLGSSDSDTEFVVIPMPKCFNLSESFVSQHMPQWLQDGSAAVEVPAKTSHKIMQMEQQEIGVISENKPNTISKNVPSPSETVSQETGVPELSVINCDQTVLDIVEKQGHSGTNSYVSVVSDGSSSEISIIESGNTSPVGNKQLVEQNVTVENATQTIRSVNISMSSGGFSPSEEVETLSVYVEGLQQNDTVEVQEDNEDNLNSATFPKFPIEGITSTFDPTPLPVSNEERVVQVLPESLVTGALSAAASVYNTARAVISTMQQPRNGSEQCLSQELPSGERSDSSLRTLNPMGQLIEMGFCNRQQNEELLKKYNGDICRVVAEYVNLDDNDWYASRHLPISPPTFD